MNRSYWIIIAAVLLAGGVTGFFIGRNQCAQCIEKTETQTAVKVETKEKKVSTTWKPKQHKRSVTYIPTKKIIALTDTSIVIDSLRTPEGVGLSFKHVISNNQLQLSEYDIIFPERTITIENTTTQTIKPRVNAFDFGIGAILPLDPLKKQRAGFILSLGYRYEKLRIGAGYDPINSQVHFEINRTF